MNIVDSSGWLEYFAGTKNARHFVQAIEDTDHLLVPSIIIYEVFRKLLQEKDEHTALTIIGHMRLSKVVDADLEVVLLAAKLGVTHKIPFADSIILATSRIHSATIFTQDSDFASIEGVRYFAKR